MEKLFSQLLAEDSKECWAEMLVAHEFDKNTVDSILTPYPSVLSEKYKRGILVLLQVYIWQKSLNDAGL